MVYHRQPDTEISGIIYYAIEVYSDVGGVQLLCSTLLFMLLYVLVLVQIIYEAILKYESNKLL